MLFNIPKREPDDVSKIIEKVQETAEFKPVLKVKNGTVLNTLELIKANVEKNLGTYHCLLLDSDEVWLDYCRNVDENTIVSLDTETSGLTFKDQVEGVAGVCIKSLNQTEAYAPIGHISTITDDYYPNQVSKEAIKQGFDILNKHGSKYIFHNAYYDLVVLKGLLGYFVPVYWDTMVASFLLNENEPHGLKYLYDKYVMKGKAGVHKFAELFDGIPFNYIPPNIGCKYSAHDSKMTESLYLFQKPFFTKGSAECTEYKLEKVADLYRTVELPIVSVFANMKWDGIQLDFKKAKELHDKYEKLKSSAMKEFNSTVANVSDEIDKYNNAHSEKLTFPINYNSPPQLKILFYDVLKSGVIYRKEPTGTGKAVINEIMHNPKYAKKPIYQIAKALAKVKMYDKVLGSFVDKLPQLALYDGKIHCNFHSLGTKTSRISSSEPNNQQLPSGNDDVRNLYTPGEGRVYLSLDAKKQEVLISAEFAKDSNMLESFRKNLDVYSHLASQIYDVSYEDCLEFNPDGTTNKEGKTRRKHAKAILLGLMYGKGKQAVADDLGISSEKASMLFDKFFQTFPQLKECIDATIKSAHENGYVETMAGYRRRLPDAQLPKYEIDLPDGLNDMAVQYYTELYRNQLYSCRSRKEEDKIVAEAKTHGVIIHCNGGLIAKAEREAFNACIQGHGGTCNKRMMLSIFNNKKLRELGTKIELTIHDEIVISCPKENAYEVAKLAEQCCIEASSIGFEVPAAFDVAIFDSWCGNEMIFNENKELVYRQ